MQGLFFIALGLVVSDIAILLKSFTSSARDFAVSFGGQNKTNALTEGSGGKAQALKDKPRAFNPLTAAGLAVGLGTGGVGFAAGAAGKVLSGAAGLTAKGAKLAFNASKIAGGGLTAGAQAFNKATGFTRKISGFVKPIGEKIRFKANSATGFLKDQLETEGDRLRNRFRDQKRIIASNLSPNMKKRIKGIKSGALETKERMKYHLNQMNENRKEWNAQRKEMADNFRKRRLALASALQDTEGYKLYREGVEGFRRELFGPAKLPTNQRFYRTVGENGLWSSALRDESYEQRGNYMSYNEAINFLNSKDIRAAFKDEEIQKLRDGIDQFKLSDERYKFSKGIYERIEQTREKLNSSYGRRFAEAFEKANSEGELLATNIIGNELGKNKNFRALVEGHIKSTLDSNAPTKEIQDARQRIIGDISKSIINGETINGENATDYLSKSEIEKLKQKIDEAQDFSKRSNILATKDALISEYKNDHPEATLEQATAIVRKETEGIVESLTRVQQATPRTEVVSNTTQTQVVQAVENSGGNTVINNTTVNNTANNTQTTQVASAQQQASNNNGNGGNTRTIEKVTERVVEKGAGSVNIDTAKLTEDIRRGLTSEMQAFGKAFNATINAEIERMKDANKLSPKEIQSLKEELNTITIDKNSNQSMDEILNQFTDEFYRNFGPTREDGKRRVKELFKNDGNIDKMGKTLDKTTGELSGRGVIRTTPDDFNKRRGRRTSTKDDVA